jgi:ankyrin repeat protein
LLKERPDEVHFMPDAVVAAAGNNGSGKETTKLLKGIGTVDIDAKDDYDRPPLSWAAESGHVTTTQVLLSTRNVDVDSKDNYGTTTL